MLSQRYLGSLRTWLASGVLSGFVRSGAFKSGTFRSGIFLSVIFLSVIFLSVIFLSVIFIAGTLVPGSLPAGVDTMTSTGEGRPVLTGIDVLQRDGFRQVAGQRIGLITNHTGLNHAGVSTAVLLQQADNTHLVALFSPEHGLSGTLDTELIDDTRDPESGLKVYSLYGESRVPSRAMLSDIDTLVFDIQDIGTRFYTYISTMGEAMKAAAQYGVAFVVLDRPNPINGITTEGPLLDSGQQSFVGFHQLPVRHGMTVGELARMFKAELQLDLELKIIAIEGWQRSDYFDQTGLQWINPSPNMRSLNAAILYPGIGLLETTNLSVGRGTDTPFEWMGAPWLDGEHLVQALNQLDLPGVQFEAVAFTPQASKFEAELCSGVSFRISQREKFQAVRTGLEIAVQLRRLYPDRWEVEGYARLLANQQVLEAVKNANSFREIESIYSADLEAFIQRRQNYLIYP